MTEQYSGLRDRVRAWYQEEVERVAAASAVSDDLAQVDFDELVRRSQVLFACELTELLERGDEPRLDPGSPDHVQLGRVAQAMRDRGLEVPDSIKQALGEE